jgi:predicted secreted protein
MDLFTGVIVYLLIWWTLLFCVLPWGNQPDQDQALGEAGSAPKNPRILKKFVATTLVSALVWLAIFVVIESNIISFHDMAKELEQQDAEKHGSS